MESKILLSEAVENKDRRFGSNLIYHPAVVIKENGEEVNALFSESQITVAMMRAERNPEDIPEDKTFWQSFFGR